MCGIVGVVGFLAAQEHQRVLADLTTASNQLVHRGPDGSGLWAATRSPVALAHRRLSVIDLSAAASQPMVDPGPPERAITFNGEIYNYRDLRRRLEKRGVQFRTESDTEVLLAACRHDGVAAALREVRGMFAFAYYDEAEQSLWLARDRFGEKPLYVGAWDGSVAFASELKALRALPGFPSAIDPSAVQSLMSHSCVGGQRSIYAAIRKVLPGTIVRIPVRDHLDLDAISTETYWDPITEARSAQDHPFQGSLDEAADELDRLLGDSVESTTVADVPLGALLSGGVDSTSIVSQLVRRTGVAPRTFTIGFGGGHQSEAAAARKIASYLGTEHTELEVSATDVLDLIPQLPTTYDEPFADSSQLPTQLVSQLARRSVTVALTGDGGDEIFGGYPRYRTAPDLFRRTSQIPRALRTFLAARLDGFGQGSIERAERLLDRGRLHRFSGGLDERTWKAASVLRANDAGDIYRLLVTSYADRSPLLQDGGGEPWALPDLDRTVEQLMLRDTVSYLPDDILTKVDRAAMSVSLETRVPILTPELFTFSHRLPTTFKIDGKVQKVVLRQLLARHVPSELWNQPKQGFSIPLGPWLRGPLRSWASDLLSPASIERHALLDATYVGHLWDEHLVGRRDWGSRLWNVLMFEAWMEQNGSPG